MTGVQGTALQEIEVAAYASILFHTVTEARASNLELSSSAQELDDSRTGTDGAAEPINYCDKDEALPAAVIFLQLLHVL